MSTTSTETASVHPAYLCSKALIKHFTARDRLTEEPELPSNLEGEILAKIKHHSFGTSMSGSSNDTKLAALRLFWWGWAEGHHWTSVGPIKPKGDAALQRWLKAQEAAGSQKEANLRRQWYPTEAEKARSAQLRQFENRKHDAVHAIRVKSIDLAYEKNTLDHTLKDLALQIGHGANNLDDLISEIKAVTRRLDEIEREGQALEAEADRIRAETLSPECSSA